MSCLDIANNKERCPEHIAQGLRSELYGNWDGKATRIVRHIDDDDGWAVQVQPYEGCTYIAMSYCWKDGSPIVDVRGLDWKVEEWNLYTLLRVCRSIDKVLAYCSDNKLDIKNAGQAIWCDAVCIDQRDGSSEKEEQVAIMGKIYRSAECVVVPCNVVERFPSIQKVLSNQFVRDHEVFGFQHIKEGVNKVFENGYFDDMWTWLIQLASESWWSRQWTLQEACCSRLILFMAIDGSLIDSTVLFTVASVVRDCIAVGSLRHDTYDGLQAVNRMVAQFLVVSLPVCVALYCPLLPAADALRMSTNRTCKKEEDYVYALLGIVGVKMRAEYNITLEEATKRFYSSCITQGDHSIIFCIGQRLHRWQMRIDRGRLYTNEKYSACAEQGVSISLVDDGKLMFSFDGECSATPMQCVYKEDDGTLSTEERFYRVIERSVSHGFSVTESCMIFNTDQNPVFITCFVLIASILGNDVLGIGYVGRIFSDMRCIVANSGPYLPEHRTDLLALLSDPKTGKGKDWACGLRILQLVGKCRLTKGLPAQAWRYYHNTKFMIAHYGDPDICTVALAVFEVDGDIRTPTCLVLSRALASEAGNSVWAVPTGYVTSCGEPLVLVGSCKHHVVSTEIEASYIGMPVVRRGLSSAMAACRTGCKSLTFV